MTEFSDAPKGFKSQPYIEAAMRDVQHYTALIHLAEGVTASGVFVNACGFDGILTAHHVAVRLMETEDFALVLGASEHRLVEKPQHCEHVEIGKPQKENDYSDNGPDLSFIILRNPIVLATLKSRVSFYSLEGNAKWKSYFEAPLERTIPQWLFIGTPYEFKEALPPDPRDGLPRTKLGHFCAQGHFKTRVERDGFDYITLEVDSGTGPFPSNYKGMSGGAFWFVAFEITENDESTIGHRIILAGIAFYQLDPENNTRLIIGHGFNSIQIRALEALQEKRKLK